MERAPAPVETCAWMLRLADLDQFAEPTSAEKFARQLGCVLLQLARGPARPRRACGRRRYGSLPEPGREALDRHVLGRRGRYGLELEPARAVMLLNAVVTHHRVSLTREHPFITAELLMESLRRTRLQGEIPPLVAASSSTSSTRRSASRQMSWSPRAAPRTGRRAVLAQGCWLLWSVDRQSRREAMIGRGRDRPPTPADRHAYPGAGARGPPRPNRRLTLADAHARLFAGFAGVSVTGLACVLASLPVRSGLGTVAVGFARPAHPPRIVGPHRTPLSARIVRRERLHGQVFDVQLELLHRGCPCEGWKRTASAKQAHRTAGKGPTPASIERNPESR
jgi:hypothetical protein